MTYFFFYLFIGTALLIGLYLNDATGSPPEPGSGRQKYSAILNPLLLPTALITYLVMDFRSAHNEAADTNYIGILFPVFLSLTIYFTALLPLLPLFRKYLRASSCAALWLLPNLLYLVQNMPRERPLLIIPALGTMTKILGIVWFCGCLTVLLYKIFSHALFRRKILSECRTLVDREILNLWEREQQTANMRKPLSAPVYSPHVRTPLSIGFFHRTIRVVLPERNYSLEELELVFRHEIIHIQRGDSCTKFFMVFCTAMCWFNPLMWVAMRRCADDLELSCDEAVLNEADSSKRRLYAQLILKTAGNEQGFTTCLSANASALSYRLKNILTPTGQRKGYFVITAVMILLMMSYGHVALAYNPMSLEEAISPSASLDIEKIYFVELGVEGDNDRICTDEDGLIRWLESLSVCQLTGSYAFPQDNGSRHLIIHYYDKQGHKAFLEFSGETLMARTCSFGSEGVMQKKKQYYLMQEPDWDYLGTILKPL